MSKDILLLLIFLIIAIGILVYLQNVSNDPICNSGKLNSNNLQTFNNADQQNQLNSFIDNNNPSVIYNNLVISLFDSGGASL